MPLHRSAQGKMIDMSTLAARNERTRAVGNMNVNARGDIIDSNNTVIKDNTKRVKTSYQKLVNNVESKKPVQQKPVPKKLQPDELSPEEQQFFNDDEDFEK
jgi:hypothetical protein